MASYCLYRTKYYRKKHHVTWVSLGSRGNEKVLSERRKYSNSITTSSLIDIFCLNMGIEIIFHVSFYFSNI